jgi:hypothetical protein
MVSLKEFGTWSFLDPKALQLTIVLLKAKTLTLMLLKPL